MTGRRDEHSRAVPGSGAGGPRDAAGHRLAERFLQDVLNDWEVHGAAAIQTVRDERPHDFLKLVTGLLPRGAEAKGDGLDDLTDEQLARQLATVLARLAEAGAGSDKGD